LDVPSQIAPDLAERYRQLRPFDEAELKLVRALVKRPDRISRREEVLLRQVLSLAKLWVLSTPADGETLSVGPVLGDFRDRATRLAESIAKLGEGFDPAELGRDAEAFSEPLVEAKTLLLSRYPGRVFPSMIDREVGQKSLVLVLGGGGGSGYVHLGAFSVLQSLGINPDLVVGSSMGSVLGLFRAREVHFREAMVRAVFHGLSFKKLFRVFETDAHYGIPGTFRLYLRSALQRFFVGEDGQSLRIGQTNVPFICVVSGLRGDAVPRDRLQSYERIFTQEFRKGAFGALLHIKDMIFSWAQLIQDIVASGLKPIALGADPETQAFDALDAVGFSCAVPALIHYDIMRDDPRMHELMQATLRRHEVDYFIDGGISANVATRIAWARATRWCWASTASRRSFAATCCSSRCSGSRPRPSREIGRLRTRCSATRTCSLRPRSCQVPSK
jgi:predicted acylesterase/phospholipase RssA